MWWSVLQENLHCLACVQMSPSSRSVSLGIMARNSALQENLRRHGPKRTRTFQPPADCPITKCSAISLYEEELKKHRATEAKLRNSATRERKLLSQMDALLKQKDIL